MSEKIGPPRRGRPPSETPKAGRGGKARVLSANITQETRDALEAEAERTGRSISQVAERWLDEARKGQADLVGMLGGLELAAAVERLVKIARAIDAMQPDVTPEERHEMLVAAWAEAMPNILPAPADNEWLAIRNHMDRFVEICGSILDVLESIGSVHPEDPQYQRAVQSPVSPIGSESIGATLARVVRHPEDFADAITALKALAEVPGEASPILKDAIRFGGDLLDHVDLHKQKRAVQRKLGASIARAVVGGRL